VIINEVRELLSKDLGEEKVPSMATAMARALRHIKKKCKNANELNRVKQTKGAGAGVEGTKADFSQISLILENHGKAFALYVLVRQNH
jgi:hypothetical protein